MNDFHSVPGSHNVHSQGLSEQHHVLSGDELHLHHRLSWTAKTPQTGKRSLVIGLQRPALLLSCLWCHRVCSPCGVLFSSLHCHLPSTPAGLRSKAKLLLAQDSGYKICDKLELSVCATAEVPQLQCASMPSAWSTDRRSWIPMCGHRAVTLM